MKAAMVSRRIEVHIENGTVWNSILVVWQKIARCCVRHTIEQKEIGNS